MSAFGAHQGHPGVLNLYESSPSGDPCRVSGERRTFALGTGLGGGSIKIGLLYPQAKLDVRS